jgi:molybdopterin-guanine dinucleotide biosynthesis protein A
MNIPALVVLAGGMGSRFGGDKQTFAFGHAKQPLLYFSAMDAYHSGVRQLVIVVRPAIAQQLRATLLPALPKDFQVDFVLQSLNDMPLLPANYAQRQKPWGTAQALWAARQLLQHRSFVVINADDYYGANALQTLVQHCQTAPSTAQNAATNPAQNSVTTAVSNIAQRDVPKFHSWAMVAYSLQATLSAYGPVNRGLCQVNAGYLAGITEVVQIQPAVSPSANAEFTGMIANLSDTTLQPVALSAQQPVSMNIWLFTPTLWPILAQALTKFAKAQPALHQECYLPTVVEQALQASIALQVYHSSSAWFGVTYPADVAQVDAYFRGQGF